MKRLLLLISIFAITIDANSQVGVGTTTPTGALDVSSTTNGFVPPRVELTSLNVQAPIVNPQSGVIPNGTIVYNIATAGTPPNNVTPGLYYWQTDRWIAFAGASGGLDWSLVGNGGTDIATNFIGTTNAVDFATRTNNTERMRVLANGKVVVNATNVSQTDNLFEVISVVDNDDAITASARGNSGIGVQGNSTLAGSGVLGTNTDTGRGVFGNSTSTGVGVLGVNNMTGVGVFGSNNNATANNDGIGVLGSITTSTTSIGTGVQGQAASPTAEGVVALNTGNGIGLYAQTNGGTNTQSIGAVYGTLDQTGAGNQDVAAVIGIQSNNRQGTGGYAGPLAATTNSSLGGVAGTFASKETNANNDSYFFGVIGDVLRDSSIPTSVIPDRTGGVMGYNGSNAFGILGYRSGNGTTFSVYGGGQAGSIAAGNAGRSTQSEENNLIGLGINGGFFGGYIKGNQYGLISKGEEFGMYVDGNTITNKPIVQLTEANNTRIATYTQTSITVDVTTRGKGKLTNGESFVTFDKNFTSLISDDIENLNITITPTGATNGVYVSKITPNGFYVKENMNGNNNASFNWVAIGTKKGNENGVKISNEILSNDFDKKMNKVMHNEGDTNSSGEPIYFDGTRVRFERYNEPIEKQNKSIPQKKKQASKAIVPDLTVKENENNSTSKK